MQSAANEGAFRQAAGDARFRYDLAAVQRMTPGRSRSDA